MDTTEKTQIDYSTRELSAMDIISADDSTLFKVVVPEWKGFVYFKAMSAQRSLEFQQILLNPSKRGGMFVNMLAECACNKDGELLFKPSDLEALRKKNVAIFLRLQSALMQLNGMIQPERNWETIAQILADSEVPAAVIATVKAKWDSIDTVQLIKND